MQPIPETLVFANEIASELKAVGPCSFLVRMWDGSTRRTTISNQPAMTGPRFPWVVYW